MLCSISNNDINTLEMLVKLVYFGNTRNVNTITFNQLRKVQFITSTSNDMRKITPSSSALYMHTLRATYTAGFQWVECINNVELPDTGLYGYIKNSKFIPKCLIEAPKFNLEKFLRTCSCKSGCCKSRKCAQMKMSCLPLCHCNKKCENMFSQLYLSFI